jgi:hypothetical protein
LCCPWFWTSTSVHDTWFCPNWILWLTLTFWLVLAVLFLQVLKMNMTMKIYFKSFSLGFSLGAIL